MRTADEIRAARLREACACGEKTKKKVSADQPPEGDGGIDVQTEQVDPFVARAAQAILEGVQAPLPKRPQSKAVSTALAMVRRGVRGVSA